MEKLNEIGDGRIVKMEVDYSDRTDKTILESETKAKVSPQIDSVAYLQKWSLVST